MSSYSAIMPFFILSFILLSCDNNPEVQSSSQHTGTPVAGFEVKEHNLSRTVSASGAVQALYVQIMGAPFSGIVKSIYVEEGDEISAGDRIAS